MLRSATEGQKFARKVFPKVNGKATPEKPANPDDAGSYQADLKEIERAEGTLQMSQQLLRAVSQMDGQPEDLNPEVGQVEVLQPVVNGERYDGHVRTDGDHLISNLPNTEVDYRESQDSQTCEVSYLVGDAVHHWRVQSTPTTLTIDTD